VLVFNKETHQEKGAGGSARTGRMVRDGERVSCGNQEEGVSPGVRRGHRQRRGGI